MYAFVSAHMRMYAPMHMNTYMYMPVCLEISQTNVLTSPYPPQPEDGNANLLATAANDTVGMYEVYIEPDSNENEAAQHNETKEERLARIAQKRAQKAEDERKGREAAATSRGVVTELKSVLDSRTESHG